MAKLAVTEMFAVTFVSVRAGEDAVRPVDEVVTEGGSAVTASEPP